MLTTSVTALASDPAIAYFNIGALDRRPCDPVRGFFLTRVFGMGREGVIEGGTINVLRVRRQVTCDRIRQIFVGAIGHQRRSVRRAHIWDKLSRPHPDEGGANRAIMWGG